MDYRLPMHPDKCKHKIQSYEIVEIQAVRIYRDKLNYFARVLNEPCRAKEKENSFCTAKGMRVQNRNG
jgi:hypothetical protein